MDTIKDPLDEQVSLADIFGTIAEAKEAVGRFESERAARGQTHQQEVSDTVTRLRDWAVLTCTDQSPLLAAMQFKVMENGCIILGDEVARRIADVLSPKSA